MVQGVVLPLLLQPPEPLLLHNVFATLDVFQAQSVPASVQLALAHPCSVLAGAVLLHLHVAATTAPAITPIAAIPIRSLCNVFVFSLFNMSISFLLLFWFCCLIFWLVYA